MLLSIVKVQIILLTSPHIFPVTKPDFNSKILINIKHLQTVDQSRQKVKNNKNLNCLSKLGRENYFVLRLVKGGEGKIERGMGGE